MGYHPLQFSGLYTIDGSIKGWSTQLLCEAGILIEIGGLDGSGGSPRLGEPVGTVIGINAIIGYGCIDCYVGWINSNVTAKAGSYFMVAGTSTCFIHLSD